jgi:hypothetical protein
MRPDQHITQDEWLVAAVDRADLAADRQAHLDACPACQQKLAQLTGRLARLGTRAADFAPKPSRPFRLPAKSTPAVRWTLKPAWALGVTSALLLAITLWNPSWLNPTSEEEAALIDLPADRRLMVAVDALVSNALPDTYQDLAAMIDPPAENDAGDDEDLLDWIVPPIEDDAQNDKSLS